MYIRTKDGVYEVKVNKYHELVYCKDNQIVLSCNILKQSDTIEELCDMTIVVDDERPDNVFELEWGIDEDLINKYKDVKGVYVYGAVWCEFGLKYVAKLNSKGNLNYYESKLL